MSFDPARHPSAVRLRDLIEGGIPLGIHCIRCGKFSAIDAGGLGLDPNTFVLALAGRFRCSRCGSRNSEARGLSAAARRARAASLGGTAGRVRTIREPTHVQVQWPKRKAAEAAVVQGRKRTVSGVRRCSL
ncbi:hypothetical protein ACUN0C_19395 [Faunimonas sp. B44]